MSARTAKRPTRVYLDGPAGCGRYCLPPAAIAILLPYLAPYKETELPADSVSVEPFLAKIYAEGGGRAAVLLRGARLKVQMSQKAVALAAKVQAAHLSAMERGGRPVGKTVAQRLARVLGCDWRSLVTE